MSVIILYVHVGFAGVGQIAARRGRKCRRTARNEDGGIIPRLVFWGPLLHGRNYDRG